MPAYINRHGFVLPKCDATEQNKTRILNELVVLPKVKNTFVEPEPYAVYTHDNENYYLPRHWALERINANPEIKLMYNPNSQADFYFKGNLRPKQVPIIDALVNGFIDPNTKRLRKFQGKIINIGTGMGKTVLALFMMCFLKRKTLIITHTGPLEIQWKERIEEYVNGDKIGYIQGQKYKIDGCNIVVAKVQSLMVSKLPLSELLKDFDCVIYDETHHYASKVFSRVMNRLAFPYSIALTATFERKDKLEHVLNMYLGEIGYKISGQLDYDFDIEVINFNSDNTKLFKQCILPGNKINIGKMMTNITLIDERNNLIVNRIRKLLEEEPERHIMMISHRLEHLFYLKEEFEKYYPDEIGMIIGKQGQKKITDEQQKQVEGKKIVLGIYNLCKEGVDISTICCVALLTPMSDPIQCCGRMLRRKRHEYIHIPKILDFHDQLGIFMGMHKSRVKFYKESYLQSDNSVMKYWNCNPDTNYEVILDREINLNQLLKPIVIKKDEDLMNSDSEEE